MTTVLDAAPPHSIPAERAVLGSLLADRDTIIRVAPLLDADDFFDAGHRAIYRAARALYARRVPPEVLTVIAELERDPQAMAATGGLQIVADLYAETFTAVHAEHYAGIVKEKAVRRRFADAASRLVRAAYDETLSIDEVVATGHTAVTQAGSGEAGPGYVTMLAAVQEALNEIYERTASAIPTGIGELDRRFLGGGMRGGQMIVIAARTGMGKTALAGQIALHVAANHRTPVVIFSLEMTYRQLARRFIGTESRIDIKAFQQLIANLPDGWEERVNDAAGRLGNMPITIADRSAVSLAAVEARARELVARDGAGLIVVDYLQLIQTASARGENRAQAVAEISRGLKLLAVQLDVPLIALSQLNREIEHRTGQDALPKPSDLRESGAIEQDADVILFIVQDIKPEHENEPSPAGIYVAKNREGPVGQVDVTWEPRVTRFVPNVGEGPYARTR